MRTKPFIVIRYHKSPTTSKRGYRWTCTVCEVSGMHRFDRWTDWVRRRRPDLHPWLRCLAAVELHLFRAHRSTEPNGCRWCGIEPRVHYGQWEPRAGWHPWAVPTDKQRKARMLARRAAAGRPPVRVGRAG